MTKDARNHRLRQGRFSELGRVYLITAATAARQPLLAEFLSARAVVNAMRYQHERGRVESLAFVVMPDHFHWMFVLEVESLSAVVKDVKAFSARAIHARTGGSGRLWQAGFYDRALRREEDLVTVARYIVANPLRGRLVERLADYPHWDAKWL